MEAFDPMDKHISLEAAYESWPQIEAANTTHTEIQSLQRELRWDEERFGSANQAEIESKLVDAKCVFAGLNKTIGQQELPPEEAQIEEPEVGKRQGESTEAYYRRLQLERQFGDIF